jgi:POT family proton-dependent oligopeptide transporter
LSVGFFAWAFLSGGWTRVERNHLILIGVLFVGYALFASSFEQAGSTLNLFADRNTDNRIFGWSFPSSWFQSVNALFVIVFAPMFAWLWIRLASRGKEPGPVLKFSVGLLLVGAGFLVLIPPAYEAERGVLVGPGWLILTYLLHTWGELALSPVGLSAMSKLAPIRIGGLVMGVWFLGTSVGNFLAGRAAGFYESMTIPNLFIAVTAFTVGAGVMFLIFSRPLNKLGADVA